MLEYISDAIVLNKEPNGDMDIRFSVFTKKFGKLKARAKSARKITSKLSAHLEPGNLIQLRLVEKNGLQAVDALKRHPIKVNLIDLYFLDKVLAEAEPDQKLWQMMVGEKFNWPEVLKLLGWDPSSASCYNCDRSGPPYFNVNEQSFLCSLCVSQEGKNKLLYIGNNQ